MIWSLSPLLGAVLDRGGDKDGALSGAAVPAAAAEKCRLDGNEVAAVVVAAAADAAASRLEGDEEDSLKCEIARLIGTRSIPDRWGDGRENKGGRRNKGWPSPT